MWDSSGQGSSPVVGGDSSGVVGWVLGSSLLSKRYHLGVTFVCDVQSNSFFGVTWCGVLFPVDCLGMGLLCCRHVA